MAFGDGDGGQHHVLWGESGGQGVMRGEPALSGHRKTEELFWEVVRS